MIDQSRQELEAQVREFLRKGGQVTVCRAQKEKKSLAFSRYSASSKFAKASHVGRKQLTVARQLSLGV